MNTVCHEYIENLSQYSEGMKKVYNDVFEYWNPREPPLTILFGAIGDRIAEDFEIVEVENNSRIFHTIESAMLSNDTELVTAVATGLVESLVTRASQNEELLGRIWLMLGEQSRKHAEAWLYG